MGVTPRRAELTDPESFVAGALACDAVVHCAFIHDFSRFVENMEIEQRTVKAMLEALAGSGMPFITTSGIAMLAPGRVATEKDQPQPFGRGATERMVLDAAAKGLRTAVIRLPPITHDEGDGGFLPPLVNVAREKGVAAYVGDGQNRWPAGNRQDAARLYRLALEKGEPGSAYMAVDDEGVPMRQIAEAIAARFDLPARSITAEEAPAHFGWLGMFTAVDMPASSAITRKALGWTPTHTGLLDDIRTARSFGGHRI
jgi:nucleoside-diphosphate-sugar epimerase